MLGFVFAVSLCVCLSVWAVCLGDVCVCVCGSTLCLVSVCLRGEMFVLLSFFLFLFSFFCLSFVRLLLVYIQMKIRVFLFLLSSRSEEGRIWCLGWWSSLENSVSVNAEKANWVNGCTEKRHFLKKRSKNVKWQLKRRATEYLAPD